MISRFLPHLHSLPSERHNPTRVGRKCSTLTMMDFQHGHWILTQCVSSWPLISSSCWLTWSFKDACCILFCCILYYFIYFLAQKSPPLWSLCQASFWVHCHLQDKYSAFILYTFCLVLESVVYPWNHGSFYWSMELDARSWALHVLTCSGIIFFFFILKILGYIRYLWILLATAMYVCYLQISIQEYIRSMQTNFNSCIIKSSWQLCSKILPLTEPVLTKHKSPWLPLWFHIPERTYC